MRDSHKSAKGGKEYEEEITGESLQERMIGE